MILQRYYETFDPFLTILVPGMVCILYSHEMIAERIYEVLAVGINVQLSLFLCVSFVASNAKSFPHLSHSTPGNATYGNMLLSAAYYAAAYCTLPLAEMLESHFSRVAMYHAACSQMLPGIAPFEHVGLVMNSRYVIHFIIVFFFCLLCQF